MIKKFQIPPIVPLFRPQVDYMGSLVTLFDFGFVLCYQRNWGKHHLCSWPLNQSPQCPEVLFDAPRTCFINLLVASLDNHQWVIIRQLNLSKESLTGAPGKQKISLWDRSSSHTEPSVPLIMELPTTITLSFLTPVVLIHLVDWLFWSMPQTELHLCCLLPDPQFPKHHTYFVRALGKVREARRA